MCPVRVLAVTLDYPPRRRIGSELCTHEVLSRMVARGHEVMVCPTDASGRWVVDGVRVDSRRPPAGWADVVWTHAELLGHVPRGVPVVAATHNTRAAVVRGLRARAPDLVVHNAEATRAALTSRWPHRGVPQVVCRPTVDLEAFQPRPGPHDQVLMVGGSRPKGVEVLRALLGKRDDRWLLVRGGYGPQVRIEDRRLQVMGHTSDMPGVYGRARVLIAPSVTESYGRVVVEALACGVPVLASDLPGMREAGGDAATYLPVGMPHRWAAALRALDDPDVYADAVARGLAHVATLDPVGDLDRVADAVESLPLGREVEGARVVR